MIPSRPSGLRSEGNGRVAERPMAPVLKTGGERSPAGPNPAPSAKAYGGLGERLIPSASKAGGRKARRFESCTLRHIGDLLKPGPRGRFAKPLAGRKPWRGSESRSLRHEKNSLPEFRPKNGIPQKGDIIIPQLPLLKSDLFGDRLRKKNVAVRKCFLAKRFGEPNRGSNLGACITGLSAIVWDGLTRDRRPGGRSVGTPNRH